jgi:hypothetical protein
VVRFLNDPSVSLARDVFLLAVLAGVPLLSLWLAAVRFQAVRKRKAVYDAWAARAAEIRAGSRFDPRRWPADEPWFP